MGTLLTKLSKSKNKQTKLSKKDSLKRTISLIIENENENKENKIQSQEKLILNIILIILYFSSLILFELIEMAFMYFSHCTAHSYFYSSKYALYTHRFGL